MELRVLVTTAGPQVPAPGLPVVVEVRDTSQLDVAATTVASATAVTGAIDPGDATFAEDPQGHQPVASVGVTLPAGAATQPAAHATLTVWARVVASGTEHVATGDWITVQAYPVSSQAVVVDVVPV